VYSPGVDVSLYDKILDPPLNEGGLQFMRTCAFSGTRLTKLGISGTVKGMTYAEYSEGNDSPAAFDAVTLNLYSLPFDKPLTITFEDPEPKYTPTILSGSEVAI
jgi:hypothetical protein